MPTFEEVQQFINDNQKEENVQKLIGGFVTTDRVSSFLESDEGKKLIQPKLHSHFDKSLETWKANNLQKLIDDEVTKRNPAQTEEQKRLKKIEEDNLKLSNQLKQSQLKDQYIKTAEKDGVPLSLLDFVISSDENQTETRYNSLKEVFNSELDKALKSNFSNNGRRPNPGDDKGKGGINAAIRKAAGYN